MRVNIGSSVVRTDARSLGVLSRDYQIFLGWVDLLSYGASRRAWSSAIKTCIKYCFALPNNYRLRASSPERSCVGAVIIIIIIFIEETFS